MLEHSANTIARAISVMLLLAVVLFNIFFTANYDYADFPYFARHGFDGGLYLMLSAAILSLVLLTGKNV